MAWPTKPAAGVKTSSPPKIATVPSESGTSALTMVKGSPSTSMSFAKTSILTSVSKLVDATSSLTIGASFTGVTVTLTVALSVSPLLSCTVYEILARPLKSGAGVNTSSLFCMLTEPSDGGTDALIIERGCPFGLVSLDKTSMLIEPASSSIKALSSCASGPEGCGSVRIDSISANSIMPD